MSTLLRRDSYSDDMSYSPTTFVLITLVLLSGCCVASIIILRRRRLNHARSTTLPLHHRPGHQRTLTIATGPSNARGESIFVYDEKMNLIANSHGPSDRPVPEIHVTFPDEEGTSDQRNTGRVVVLRISDSGSVGMEPLNHEPAPPYQRSDAERFQSLDLDRMGGLREKAQPTSQRYS